MKIKSESGDLNRISLVEVEEIKRIIKINYRDFIV